MRHILLRKHVFFVVGMLFLFMPKWCLAGTYSVDDLIYYFNLLDQEVEEFDVESCETIPFLQKSICQEIKDKITSKLAVVSPYIGDGELIKRDLWTGSEKYGDNIYITKTDLKLYVDGSTSISFNDDGLCIDDIFYPYIARFYFLAGATGDGDGYVKNKVCADPPFCLVYTTYKDYFDIDFSGQVEFDVIAGLSVNPTLLETEDEYILILQPNFRLLPRKSDVDISYDIDGIDPFTPIANLINVQESAFDLSVDLALFDFDSAIEDFISMHLSGAVSLVSAHILFDDMTFDSISYLLSEITTYFADDYLDEETERVLYSQESAVNSAISDTLGLDDEGLVAYHFSKSLIHGKSFAEVLPALSLLF